MAIGRGRVVRRGTALWLDYDDETGRRRRQSTGLRVGQEHDAERLLEAMLRRVRAAAERAEEGLDPRTVTVERWAEEWISRRERLGVAMTRDERQRLRAYIAPGLGHLRVREVTPEQVARWVDGLRDRLAPRSVLHVYGTLRQIMKAAVRKGIIASTPCVLGREELPTLQDRDPEWRHGAVYTRDELELLISHPDIPEERRLGYAFMGLAGLRWGEVAALRWRAWDAQQPLGMLTVAVAISDRRRALDRRRGDDDSTGLGATKTGAVRRVPVHPTLAAMLAAWRLRHPGRPDDLILPGVDGVSPRRTASAYKSLRVDLRRLGLRERRLHDFRRTFVSLAQADGAAPSVLRWITHTPVRSDMIATYSSLPWATLCAAVSCIRVEVRRGEVRELRAAIGAESQHLPDTPLTHPKRGKGKAPESQRIPGPLVVGATGFEPVDFASDESGHGRPSREKSIGCDADASRQIRQNVPDSAGGVSGVTDVARLLTEALGAWLAARDRADLRRRLEEILDALPDR